MQRRCNALRKRIIVDIGLNQDKKNPYYLNFRINSNIQKVLEDKKKYISATRLYRNLFNFITKNTDRIMF